MVPVSCVLFFSIFFVGSISSFVVMPMTTRCRRHARPLLAAKTTLTEETTWNLRFLLNGIPTEKGKKVDQLFQLQAMFVEEEGFEPPQGRVVQVKGEDTTLEIVESRWQLSEDPDDRKDGLWVWGLFSEPLYPFLLLQLETAKYDLPGRDDGDAILPLQLFSQISHSRDEEKGVILSQAALKVREMETVKADPFGAAKVDIYEEMTVGQLSIKALG